ncbi:unnamed protein product [Mytilus edulis]|uniref:B box-type domain-containing protein n=1 Tax=Mytilus edulis TaxID=6550 RepID=A0A8S3V6C2_MYTED|nr:unnamed protein product [Mytilus edulis]
MIKFLEKQWMHTINDALQKWKDYEYHNEIRCPLCTVGDRAVKYCFVCEVPIDQQCLCFHETMNSYLDHTTISIIDVDQRFKIKHFATKRNCPNHRLLQSTSYCTSCSKFVCQECAEYHLKMNHNVDMLIDVYLLFDKLHALKRSSEDKIHSNPDLSEEEHAVLKMSITWIEVILVFEMIIPILMQYLFKLIYVMH